MLEKISQEEHLLRQLHDTITQTSPSQSIVLEAALSAHASTNRDQKKYEQDFKVSDLQALIHQVEEFEIVTPEGKILREAAKSILQLRTALRNGDWKILENTIQG